MKKPIPAVILAASALLCCVAGVLAQERKADNTRRDLELWAVLKRALSGPDGEEYFREKLKDSALPILVGTLISDPAIPEVTLRLKDDTGKDAHLNSPVMRGSQIRFEAQ
jgi:hypothetical protein